MTLLKDIVKLDNGAHFYDIDLHIHSYGGSHDVKDATMTPEAIVDSAVRQGLRVISITDHNSNMNVQRAISHADKNHKGEILVLPGVEITTAHGHLLAYFAPEAMKDLTKLLSRLDLIGELGADNTRTAKSMSDTITEVARLGGLCVAAHIDRDKTGFEAFATGFQNWKRDIITHPGLYGLEADSVEALSWYSEIDVGPAGTERKKLFLAREGVPELSARPHLAHVQGSDAHSMGQFEQQTPNKRWTRIKLTELSFQAFRIAMVDPTARVKASAPLPFSVPRIHGVAITGGFLDGEEIHFSPNLNCFIGGRGTGKSTAIRAVAYAFGINNEFEAYDNCSDVTTVFCEDENGIQYRYTRTRGGDIDVKAKEDGSITEVPIDAFQIEYFGQGELAKIAEDPLKNPRLLQDFLDRQISLRDLVETEVALVTSLQENAGRLVPLEGMFSQLPEKKKHLAEIEKKLTLAEQGNLRGIVSAQNKIASERVIRSSADEVSAFYKSGISLSIALKDIDQTIATAGECTDDPISTAAIAALRGIISRNNIDVQKKETELNAMLAACATELDKNISQLKLSDSRITSELAAEVAKLKSQGVATDRPGLDALLKQKTSVAREIASIEQRSEEARKCREERVKLRTRLKQVRDEMTMRRKSQLKGINTNLGSTIKDYTIFIKYDGDGITNTFEEFMRQKMHGSFMQDSVIQLLCSKINPSELADLALARNHREICAKTGVSQENCLKVVEKICYWSILFDLQILAKHPKPLITVRTKSLPFKEIPVLQLSDGQRHTILLTIAMLAESNVPLVIDQPEDDLDNAFISSSLVKTLRAVKERRQVIVVTHNANIAVLGDSELIVPMQRKMDCGKSQHKGSIDAEATKECVIGILEGGTDAFLRRKAMYNH